MTRQKERTQLAPQLKPGRCSESAMDYGVDFMVKKQKNTSKILKIFCRIHHEYSNNLCGR